MYINKYIAVLRDFSLFQDHVDHEENQDHTDTQDQKDKKEPQDHKEKLDHEDTQDKKDIQDQKDKKEILDHKDQRYVSWLKVAQCWSAFPSILYSVLQSYNKKEAVLVYEQ